MKMKWALLAVILTIATVLTGCDNPLLVLDPKGPSAKTLSDTIKFSMFMMVFVLVVVYVLYAWVLTKYRASKADKDYEPPHIEGSHKLEIIWTLIPVLLLTVLSVVTVRSIAEVEAIPKGYENQKPLVIYAASSNWKWHFSYPEEGIETVNYVNLPIKRPVEFRIYSYGPMSSLWIPQLAGQKYGMADMVTSLKLVADIPGSYLGRNAQFSGEGFAKMDFEALAMTDSDFKKWVKEVKDTAPKLTEEEFNNLLKPSIIGRKTYTSTHLSFSPPPEMKMNQGQRMDMEENKKSKENSDTQMNQGHDMNMGQDNK